MMTLNAHPFDRSRSNAWGREARERAVLKLMYAALILTEDRSLGDSLCSIRHIADQYRIVEFHYHSKNIGLERKLIEEGCI